MNPDNERHAAALYRLLAWSSPAFPTGAFSYSHGLEAAADDGTARDRETLERWVGAIVLRGSGRIDADVLCEAYRAALAGDDAALARTNGRGLAYRATAELALESEQQGAAFSAAWANAWTAPSGRSEPETKPTTDPAVCHPVAFGVAAAYGGIVLEDALLAYLQAFASNLVWAGIRLGIVGQTDGQRILAALGPGIAEAAGAALTRAPEEFGAATFAVDLASMAHETQYTRLFRS